MSSGRYVFDTNTLLSALMFEHSTPGRALYRALRLGTILLSPATLEELAEVVQRDKFDRYVTRSDREEFLEGLIERAMFVDAADEIHACRDPRDDKFLDLAISGKADYIVSGDNDLLSLHPFQNVAVVTSAAFLAATDEEVDIDPTGRD